MPPRPLVSATAALIVVVAGSDAAAHVIATPAFVPRGSSESITLSAPNERDAAMTGFSVTAPEGLAIEDTHVVDGWTEELEGPTARWSGSSVSSNAEVRFGITLEADAEPGVLTLEAKQLYADGGEVSWRVPITITPAKETPSQNLALAGVVGLVGVLTAVAIAMLARRLRS